MVHGWGGSPEGGWFPWLKKELEQRKFKAIVPKMPDTENPKIEEWVPFLKNVVGDADENTYFVGGSIGCQTILRYLERLPEKIRIGGIIFVAPWFNMFPEPIEEEGGTEIAKPWLETPIDTKKVLTHTDRIAAIFSDDDPFVPLTDAKIFKEKLKAKIIIEHGKGHFDDKKYPIILKAVLGLIKTKK